jgi:hypothetical protein
VRWILTQHLLIRPDVAMRPDLSYWPVVMCFVFHKLALELVRETSLRGYVVNFLSCVQIIICCF